MSKGAENPKGATRLNYNGGNQTMKKILSLVLAAAMLSTTAFAATNIGGVGASDINAVDPGETLRIDAKYFKDNATGANNTLADIDWRLSTEYFTVSSKKFDKGANLVKEVKINDTENTVDIVLNENLDLLAPKGANLVIKELGIKAKKKYDVGNDNKYLDGEIKQNVTYKYFGENELYVGYDSTKANLEVPLDSSPEYKDGTIVKFVKGADTSIVYETASLSTGDVYMEGRVYDGDKVYVGVDYDVNKDILKMDDTAAMRFINIKLSGLPTANTLKLTAEEDEFVYKIVDGKLTPSGLKWSDDDYAWVGKIRSTTSFVISDVELKSAPAAEGGTGTGNPDTGANDVVGIAAALAVVSLVAAGAVSLKK